MRDYKIPIIKYILRIGVPQRLKFSKKFLIKKIWDRLYLHANNGGRALKKYHILRPVKQQQRWRLKTCFSITEVNLRIYGINDLEKICHGHSERIKGNIMGWSAVGERY